MIFDKESEFEENVISVLKQHGWTDGVLRYPTEIGHRTRAMPSYLKPKPKCAKFRTLSG